MSTDHSLTGKGKNRIPRRVATKLRHSTMRGEKAFIEWCASLSREDTRRIHVLINTSMLHGCSQEALGALGSVHRWTGYSRPNQSGAVSPWLVRNAVEKVFLECSVCADDVGYVDWTVPTREGVDGDETNSSTDDSFKKAFRELRGSIDPDLNLEF